MSKKHKTTSKTASKTVNLNCMPYYIIEAFLLIFWINTLRESSAHYIVYLICFGASFCSLGIRIYENKILNFANDEKWNFILACIFSTFIAFGNYELIAAFTGIRCIFMAIILFFSSIVVFYNIFAVANMCFKNMKGQNSNIISPKEKQFVFFIPFCIFVIIDLIYLFAAIYPGNCSPDSIEQIYQIQKGVYSNHHPFYHTMLIKPFFSLGMKLFNDVNAAIATYIVFQIFLMALIFSYAVMTVYELKRSKAAFIVVTLFYALMPYHWNYSCTMWKDVIFGGACTIFVISLYRTRKNMGNELFNHILLFVSSIGFCLFRSNGTFAFFITLICLFAAFRNKNKKLLSITLTAFIIALIMKGPVLKIINVIQPDTIESLSIPAQQIARVIYNDLQIEDSDMELLREVIDVDAVKQYYKPYISDPIKNLVRQSSGNDAISENKAEYFALWIRIGLKHPGTYIAAWIEQTKGYWNAGYDYWFCFTGVSGNSIGVEHSIKSETLFRFTYNYIDGFRENTFLCIFVSIGFCFWIYLVLFWFNITDKKDGWIETVPFIAIIISLCVATPVFNEFRYSYGLYSSIPFVLFSALCKI